MGSRGAGSGRMAAGSNSEYPNGGTIDLFSRGKYDITPMGKGYSFQNRDGDEEYYKTFDDAVKGALQDAGYEYAFKIDTKNMKGSDTTGKLITKELNKNNIDYFNNQYGTMVADVKGNGTYNPITYVGKGFVAIDTTSEYSNPAGRTTKPNRTKRK